MMHNCCRIFLTKVDQIEIIMIKLISEVILKQTTTHRFRICVTKKTIINKSHHSNRIMLITRSKAKAINKCHRNMFSTRVSLNPKTKSILQRRQIRDRARIVRETWEIIKRICHISIKTKTVVLKLMVLMKGKNKLKLWTFRFQIANQTKENKLKSNKI